MITSRRNSKIQWVRSLQSRSRTRRQEGAFVVEGVRLCEEALASDWEALLVLYTQDLDSRAQAVVEGFAAQGAPIEQVSFKVMQAASDTQTPQGVLAALKIQPLPLPPSLDFALIADEVRDPGNLGTILRTSAAAGAGAVCLPAGTVDVYSPKVVRAGMGAHFRLPILAGEWQEIRAALDGAAPEPGLQVYLAQAGAGQPYTQADFRRPLALVIGGEAWGAGGEARDLADKRIHIPMPGKVESLNAAVAAAVLLFEVVRQRTV
jgi:TrmH family RNA methyltransferase